MQASFIIPLYNCLTLTQAMLASLRETLPQDLSHEIIFVDDGSTDGTRAWLESLGSTCRVILNEKNLGFAGTCNRGAEVAKGEFLFFLNNDLIMLKGWFEPMLDGMRQQPHYGALGNLHYRADDNTLDHAGVFVATNGKLMHVKKPSGPVGITTVAAISGACLLVRRCDFQTVDGFNQEFKNGGEDIDLCFQLQRRGLKCGIVNDSAVLHHVSASRGIVKSRDEMNSWLLVQKWHDEMVYWGSITWAGDQLKYLSRPWTFRGLRAWWALAFVKGWTRRPPTRARNLMCGSFRREIQRWEKMFPEIT